MLSMSARLWRAAVVWVAAIGMTVATASLAVWQWGRAQTKDRAWAEAQALQHAPVWSADRWPCGAGSASVARFQRVRLQGHWLTDRSVWLDNRSMNGSTGFILVTPLLLTGPSACVGQIVLVERGWAPRDAMRRDHLPPLPTESGQVEVMGHVEPALSAAYALGQEADPPVPQASPAAFVAPIRQNAAPDFWQRWLARDLAVQGQARRLASVVVRQHEPTTAGLHRAWPLGWQGTTPDRHRAYAAQWAAMSLVCLGLSLWFLVIRPQQHDHDVHAPTFQA